MLARTIFVILFAFGFAVNSYAEPLPAVAKPFNPDISANFLGLLRHGTAYSNSRSTSPYNGLSLQEAEIYFSSNIDAYLKGVALFALTEDSGSWGIEPEEVYVETTSLPYVTIRAGTFKLAFGKHNQLHTHAFPFIDAPIAQQTILGEEGLNSPAASASILIPLPWFSEFTTQAYSLSNENLYSDPVASTNTGSDKTGALVRFRNLWEFGDDTTLELGASAAEGKNAFDKTTTLYGGDLTLKWRPSVGGKYRAFTWSSEYMSANRRNRLDDSGNPNARLGGGSTYFQYQFAERWWVQARAEVLGSPRETGQTLFTKQSALLGFFPSEFSGLRAQYDTENNRARNRKDYTFTLQYNITMGAHPAHLY
jgi:hypothetical protein